MILLPQIRMTQNRTCTEACEGTGSGKSGHVTDLVAVIFACICTPKEGLPRKTSIWRGRAWRAHDREVAIRGSCFLDYSRLDHLGHLNFGILNLGLQKNNVCKVSVKMFSNKHAEGTGETCRFMRCPPGVRFAMIVMELLAPGVTEWKGGFSCKDA